MFKKIPFISISPVGTSSIQFASNFSVTAKPDGTPSKIVINIAIDPGRSGKDNGQREMPVFIPILGDFPDPETKRMKDLFEKGDPFVVISIENLDVYYKEEETGQTGYIGFGMSYELVPDPLTYIEEEDAL